MAILLMPTLVGMSGFVSRSEAFPEIAAARNMVLSGHETCTDDHSVCSADDCCEWGQCVNCTVLPPRTEALGAAPRIMNWRFAMEQHVPNVCAPFSGPADAATRTSFRRTAGMSVLHLKARD